MRTPFLILVLLFSASAMAKVTKEKGPNCETPLEENANQIMKVADKAGGCPKLDGLRNLCDFVSTKMEDKRDDSPYIYLYEKTMYEASCSDIEKDSLEVVQKKMQKLWNENQKLFKCTAGELDVMNGSVLKLAVRTLSFGFFDAVISEWKLDLNYIDESDNRTVLDYIEYEIKRTEGSDIEPRLRMYYEVLRKKGAKLRREL
ncbi:MAG: hypothetical protein AB7I27_15720 [Bacteriovoracaceae bacterium]